MRGETKLYGGFKNDYKISIHSPHAGRDDIYDWISQGMTEFQSTLPMRGETAVMHVPVTSPGISIHSPHAGRDGIYQKIHSHGQRFQSTLPMRGETHGRMQL